jgi:hypothetical protein
VAGPGHAPIIAERNVIVALPSQPAVQLLIFPNDFFTFLLDASPT